MKTYDFDKIIERRGTGAIKTDALKKVFGKEPQPMPDDVFWKRLAELSAIHDRIHNITLRKQMEKLILEIQAEATLPKEVINHGDDEPVAH